MNWQDYTATTPGIRSGKPCIVGTRISLRDVLEYLAGGMSEAEILADFPQLWSEHIRAVLAFASDRAVTTRCVGAAIGGTRSTNVREEWSRRPLANGDGRQIDAWNLHAERIRSPHHIITRPARREGNPGAIGAICG